MRLYNHFSSEKRMDTAVRHIHSFAKALPINIF
jgi:hypothetical protein